MNEYRRRQVWQWWMKMDPAKWEALADLIEWAAAETDRTDRELEP